MEKFGKVKRGVKEAILNLLSQNREWHPTARELFEALKEKFPRLAFSSVYRAIDSLIAEKKIISFKLEDEEERRFEIFDKLHPHFKCTVCGKVYDIDIDLNTAFKELAELHTEHLIYKARVTYYGICRECFNKKLQEFVRKYNA